jgi:putative glutamine amidotransferase
VHPYLTLRLPIIGINTGFSRPELELPAVTLRYTYVNATLRAGGVPLLLPPGGDADIVERMVDTCDGFIFTGGPDISAEWLGEELHTMASVMPPERESMDRTLMDAVIAARKPLMGICLGCQEMNLLLGGTIIQDIYDEAPGGIQHTSKQAPFVTRHPASIEPDTLLNTIVKCETLEINSAHHQSIRQPGANIRVSARAADGIIEAVEMVDYPFGLGIQWHPEYLVDEAPHLALFEALVSAARR